MGMMTSLQGETTMIAANSVVDASGTAKSSSRRNRLKRKRERREKQSEKNVLPETGAAQCENDVATSDKASTQQQQQVDNQKMNETDRKQIKKKKKYKGDSIETARNSLSATAVVVLPKWKQQNSVRDSKKPLNGLIVAISTLDQRDNITKKHSSSDSSYSFVSSECKELGATVSPQVHKRVFAVICNKSAVRNATQRVRKALLKTNNQALLIDVEWVRHCKAMGERMDYTPYLLTQLAEEVMASMATVKGESNGMSERTGNKYPTSNAGWTDPIPLDCCCICHENGDLTCEWCLECNVTLTRVANEEKSTKS